MLLLQICLNGIIIALMYYLITNPASQSGNSHDSIVKKLESVLRQRNVPFETRYTHSPDDAGRFAAEISSMNKENTIVVIGGDGTINAVINGIADFSRVKFGFIPAGSANDLAKGLGIKDINSDHSQDENIRHIADGNVLRTIDLGQIEYDGKSRLFAVSAGIGFDAAVCRESDVSKTREFFNRVHLGRLTYGAIALKQLITAPEVKCDITLSNGTEFHIGKLVFATFMNTPYEGGGYKFAPDAVPTDGDINVSAIGDLSKLTVLINFPSAHKGTYYRVPGVFHSHAPEIKVHSASPLWVHTDGEVIGQPQDFVIRCQPQKLQMVV